MSSEPDTKTCPMCGAAIKAVARKCRFCGEILTAGDRPGSEESLAIWREGRLLVMHKRAVLPEVCVRSNEPADGTIRRRMWWHHPLVYLALLGGLCPYVIVALLLQKKADIRVPICRGCRSRRLQLRLLEWLLVLAAAGGVVLGIRAGGTAVPLSMLGGFVLLIVVAILEGKVGCVVRPKRITDKHVWLIGVHRDYLAALPEFPGEHAV